jgi:putative transposase
MSPYRRIFVPGGTWFFTVNLLERRTRLLTQNITPLRHAIFWTKRRLPFRIDALVVLPDHLHAVITLPPDDSNFPLRLRHIKSHFSRSLVKTEWLSTVRQKRGERGIWQRRYWEHYIRDKQDFRNHVAYCYYNPVKHGHVQSPRDWPHSTYLRDVRAGRFEADFQIGDWTKPENIDDDP